MQSEREHHGLNAPASRVAGCGISRLQVTVAQSRLVVNNKAQMSACPSDRVDPVGEVRSLRWMASKRCLGRW